MILTLFIVFFGAVLAGGIFYFLVKMSDSVRNELSQMNGKVSTYLEQSARVSQQTGEGAVKAMGDVYRRMAALEESSNRIYEIGKEIGKLQDVLKAPKARGGFGELMLADLLRQVIPQDRFQLQYLFRNGTRVDAALFLGNFFVPIDSKFPLENFQRILSSQQPDERKKLKREFVRDVKKHIDVISQRYISPEEGTFDFALMYIPAENVYYEVITKDEDLDIDSLTSYALERRVIPVSPNSFYAYLQVILLGLRGLKMDYAAKEIAESLVKMRHDFRRVSEDVGVLGSHLNHAKGSFEKVQRGIDQVQIKLSLVDQIKAEDKETVPVE